MELETPLKNIGEKRKQIAVLAAEKDEQGRPLSDVVGGELMYRIKKELTSKVYDEVDELMKEEVEILIPQISKKLAEVALRSCKFNHQSIRCLMQHFIVAQKETVQTKEPEHQNN
jgi:hypothetical protein